MKTSINQTNSYNIQSNSALPQISQTSPSLPQISQSMYPNTNMSLGLPTIGRSMPQMIIPEPLNQREQSEPDEPYSIWSLCEEITSKREWYSKVFREDIVAKWREELPLDANVNFDLAINLLRASAQGVNHVKESKDFTTSEGQVYHTETCGWDDSRDMCDDCRMRLKQAIINNPEEFGLSSEDIDINFFEEGWEHDFDAWDQANCPHPLCKCRSPDCSLDDYIQYHPDGVLNADLHNECKSIIAEMAAQEPIDWHPGSNQQVRDIIHPSMYCYVKGISKHADGQVASSCDENLRYQWLPSEFSIGHNGKVTVDTYINNLKADKYPRFIPMVERVFENFFPSLETVLHKQIRSCNIQVIVKVGSINLDTTNPSYPGGSWHIEGMPYEHIAATCIHYVDINNITDSFLEFRKPVIINEDRVEYPQNNSKYTTHHYGIEPGSHHDGVMNRYLGLIRCHEGASVIFPNTLQHRVKDFALAPSATSSVRTILAFFIIDPDHEIVSTEDIPPQQQVFTEQEAQFHRERLMIHRKFFVNQLNETVFERSFSLCEH
jgi:hypothetical protein